VGALQELGGSEKPLSFKSSFTPRVFATGIDAIVLGETPIM